jgi:hypothetical protein
MRASTWVTVVGAALALMAGEAAFSEAAHENSQQQKMTSCSADAKAKSLKGDERKAFMKDCLSHHEPEAAKTNMQQEKMKSCNADAKSKSLKGDERRAFMKSCLSGSASK